MKPTFITLLALCLCLGGCGKKEAKQTAKEPSKTKKAPEKSEPKVNPTKHERFLWEFETGDAIAYSSPAIGFDGTVYVGSYKGSLYAINRSGVKLWEFETGGIVYSSPAIGPDGTLYVGSDDKKLYAIKTDAKGLAKSPWPMRGQNPQHTGRTLKKE